VFSDEVAKYGKGMRYRIMSFSEQRRLGSGNSCDFLYQEDFITKDVKETLYRTTTGPQGCRRLRLPEYKIIGI